MPNYNFPPTSRYYSVPVLSRQTADGRTVNYLSRRFVPPSAQFSLLHLHIVTEGERMDLIAARELGDPEAYWRICDANDAMRPDDLTAVPGRALRITLPQGIPGTTGS
ncbi:MAG TPA: hypothetical protein VFW46_14690 [Stellaceae bacterium]|nr:hypothetical protein [Stellaceae bacterium]